MNNYLRRQAKQSSEVKPLDKKEQQSKLTRTNKDASNKRHRSPNASKNKSPEFGRSGFLIAKNDSVISQFLADPNYYVCESGQILTKISRQGHKQSAWRIKPQTKDTDGYFNIKYCYKKLAVHRIFFAAFVGKLEADLVVNHIDGNPANNSPSNLELVTQARNCEHFAVQVRGVS